MPKTKVTINRAAWGANIMSNAALVEGPAQAVAAHLAGGEVEMITLPVRAGGTRVRARVSHGTTSREEADSNALISALSSVLPLARR